eukprot:1640070-Lingulodinium_polyedra.AAC.1
MRCTGVAATAGRWTSQGGIRRLRQEALEPAPAAMPFRAARPARSCRKAQCRQRRRRAPGRTCQPPVRRSPPGRAPRHVLATVAPP